MSLELKNKIIKVVITILLLVLPLIDCLRITPLKDIQVFNISLVEFLVLFLVFLSFLITFFKIEKKKFKFIIIYTIIFFIYLLFHSLNILRFNASLLPYSNINILQEGFYLFRIYYIPLLIFFILYQKRHS